jgi:hypothetical protein
MIRQLPLLFAISFFSACNGQVNTSPDDPYQASHPEAFADYWYAGEAEINRYELEQMRYGKKRTGEAVMVFVTEDFLLEKQVKRDFGEGEATTVLKLNYLKDFVTGFYDYSLMTSVFTPVEFRKHPSTLKVTFSSQDWCGQVFGQANLRDRRLHYQVRSYFQSEGDFDTSMTATYLEEDIWNRMRLEPQTLPMGEIEMIPSMEYLRLRHKKIKPYSCRANLFLQVKENEEFYSYELTYPELDRKLVVRCESRFPFRILGWEEILGGEVTKATLSQTTKSAYWKQNDPSDEALRDSLGLRFGYR